MKKVLFLAYYYPPVGGAGVQRVAKFVKYLPHYGFAPIIVARTAKGSESITKDFSLSTDIRSATTYRVELTKREECLRQFCLNKFVKRIPGIPFKWWVAAAKRLCHKVVQIEKPKAICVTVSPFPAVKVAEEVAKKHGIPWVVDMRDPWAIDPLRFYSTWFHYRLDLKTMRHTCHEANAVIMNTPRALAALKNRFPELPPNKLFCITNGWDKNDLNSNIISARRKSLSAPLTIVHTGGFFTRSAIGMDPSSRKVLGIRGSRLLKTFKYSLGKSHVLARSPYYLFKALRLLLDAGKISETDIHLVFVGELTQEDKNLATMFDLENIVEFKGYVSHRQSIRCLSSTDVVFLAVHKPLNGQPPLTIPGKTYEYMAMRKPILALVPPGDARDFIHQSGLGFICDPTNVEQIAQALLDLIEKHRNYSLVVNPNDQFIQQFERRRLTEKLAEVFNFAISRHCSRYSEV